MRNPYRVAVWGPGAVGSACIRLLMQRPEFELVGVLANSPAKRGLDVGEYIGGAPSGLKMTTDFDDLLALDVDCVLYAAAPPTLAPNMYDDTVRLLESGKNVINATAFWYPPHNGAAFNDRLVKACETGGTSLHGTGEQPGFFFERLALTLTGMCSDVDRLIMQEYVNVSGTSLETMGMFGVGQTLEVAEQNNAIVRDFMMSVFGEQLNLVSQALWGQHLDTIDMQTNFTVADEDIELKTGTIKKGTVGNLEYVYTGLIDRQLRLGTTIRWRFEGSERWLIEIEGRPVSFKADISALASLDGDAHFQSPDDPTFLTSYLTAMPMVQAIPVVVGAEPGIVYPTIFSNSTSDYRTLEGRRSIVD